MKFKKLAILALLALGLSHSLPASGKESSSAAMEAEVKSVIVKIQEKANAGKRTEAELAPELGQLDAIIDKYKGEKTDDVAQVLLLKARVYGELFQNNQKALEIVKQIKADLPETATGQRADDIAKSIQTMVEADAVKSALKPGVAFPSFDEKDLAGAPLSPSKYKGKIVMVDFWATWCGPCVQELPNVVAAYQKYHDKGFEIIGISLDKDRDSLAKFTASHKMAWPQYFDGRGWESKLAGQYGIKSIPATFLLDGEGKIIATDLRGPELDAELEKRLK